jgi:hypothetical protein
MRIHRRSILFALGCLSLAPPATARSAVGVTFTFTALTSHQKQALGADRKNLADLRNQMIAAGMIDRSAAMATFGQAILDHHIVSGDSESDAEAVGVLVGDCMVARGGFQWLSVSDAYGTEPVVCRAKKTAFAAPISAVRRRFRRTELDFNFAELVENLVHTCLSQEAGVAALPPALRR